MIDEKHDDIPAIPNHTGTVILVDPGITQYYV